MNSSDSSWIGRLIGDNKRYRLEKRLGGGGMGDVYQAIDMRVGQQVALKLLKGTFVASEEMRKRFEREIAVCAALPNEHIVKIIDAGVTGDIPFYVMEYLRGKTLRELLLKEKRLTVERTVAIMIQVCLGLQLAHEGVTLWQDGAKTSEHIRVVHRDLKPDNIFIIPTELGEWVKILDFGIAKIRNESSEQTNLTSTFLGTFRYAAPEQLKGDRDLDGRADIYSLGIILYEMLSAADPFGFSIKSRSISEASWIFAHTSQPPKSLRSQPGCEQLSPELEAVVIRCLQKNPDERFATVKELNRALQAVTNSTTKGHHIEIIPQPRQQEGSNDETVPRPLEAEDFDSETAARSSQTEQSNNQTIARLLKPNGEGDEGQTPAQQPSGGQNREETLFQQQPPQPPTGRNREPTLFQPQPPSNPDSRNAVKETNIQQNAGHREARKLPMNLAIVLGIGIGLVVVGGIAYAFSQSRRVIDKTPSLQRQGNYQECISIAELVPADFNLDTEAQKYLNSCRIEYARKLANENKLKEAIEEARKIPQTSPRYQEAQKNIA
ncbi:serine/threonine protein kinase [Brasilonema octagenarum]|uniref:Serine/threonine protein kinase n=1 Tax=Brasilonema octagenarum UFV-OR1 TaxID=417115 RepID=A0ABX1M1Y5_9CYAN|nr:serine/threonine-protein kinase [Brasilonema octagenarum]NMF62508.1 serine/threonine protein kinase [Brasilonema octagenarum UFV-OR1]